MSWMDTWSRPSKSQPVPPPLYLTNPDIKYCHTCGRVISERKTQAKDPTPVKYCSTRCRNSKPRAKDLSLEAAFVALLNGEREFDGKEVPTEIMDLRVKGKAKGEKRWGVPCSAVERLVFGRRDEPGKTFGRKKNRASRVIGAVEKDEEFKNVDMIDDDEIERLVDVNFFGTGFAGKPRPPQHLNEVNGGVGGEKGWAEREPETAQATEKRLQGQQVAEQRELVKRAARRGVAFGFRLEDKEDRRKCEILMNGITVEPSYAKGDFLIQWREGE